MIYIVDASVYVFRAWFSIPDSMTDDDANPVNALYGFARFLGDFLEETQPEYVAVAFDESLKTCFRNEIYPFLLRHGSDDIWNTAFGKSGRS